LLLLSHFTCWTAGSEWENLVSPIRLNVMNHPFTNISMPRSCRNLARHNPRLKVAEKVWPPTQMIRALWSAGIADLPTVRWGDAMQKPGNGARPGSNHCFWNGG